MRILQVNTLDNGGGAAKVARKLHEVYRARGHHSWMAVGVKYTGDPDVFAIEHAPAARGWGRPWWRLYDRVKSRPGHRAMRIARAAARTASPRKITDEFRGVENFEFPGTRRLLGLTPEPPDLLHLHNLHGDYFDLRMLEPLSRVPVVSTLHDAWMFTGHCGYFMDCNRWQHGCGSCPYLDVYPAMRRDSTDRNWLRKKQIYEKSTLYVAAPSRWLLERAEASMLSEAIAGTRLIPNGVDLSIFRPGDRASARARIGLPPDERILLFSGFSPATSSYKDVPTLRAAAEILGNRHDERVTLVVLGGGGPSQRIGRATVAFAGYETDEAKVAAFYQAADLYVHAARVGAESFGLAVAEALACGVPVVATAVGGIPELVRALRPSSGDSQPPERNHATGILTPPADPKALADAVAFLLGDVSLMNAMSSNAAEDARRRFDLQAQADAYLAWYAEILQIRISDCP